MFPIQYFTVGVWFYILSSFKLHLLPVLVLFRTAEKAAGVFLFYLFRFQTQSSANKNTQNETG